MTRQQIADSLGVCVAYINYAFEAAIKEHPELNIYTPSKHNQKGHGVDYTLEQVLLGLSYFREGHGISELEKQNIIDDFTMREPEKPKAIGIKGTEEFLKRIARYPRRQCCSTCSYCTKSTMRNKKPVLKPFCLLWDRFLHRLNANPYTDYCKQWEYSKREPLIFYTADSPTNLDIYGNVKNNIMGFSLDNFGKESGGEVRLVTDKGIGKIPLSED